MAPSVLGVEPVYGPGVQDASRMTSTLKVVISDDIEVK